MNDYAIGAEGTRSLDFLAPAVFAAMSSTPPRVVYFLDTSHNNFHNEEVLETLNGFVGLSVGECFEISQKMGLWGFQRERVPSAAKTVEKYLQVSGFKGKLTVVKNLPDARQLSSVLKENAKKKHSHSEIEFRQSRSCLRVACENSTEYIKKIIFKRSGEAVLITVNGREVGEGEKIICQGDYAIFKTLVFGRPGYVPWYQRSNPRLSGASISCLEVFTPLYSTRVNRRMAMHTHDLSKPLAYGYFWNFERPNKFNAITERIIDWEPCNLTKRICELIVSPQRESSVRRRAANDVVEGLVTSPILNVEDYMLLIKNANSQIDREAAAVLFHLLAVLKAGRAAKKVFQAKRGEKSAEISARKIMLSLRYVEKIAQEKNIVYLNAATELLSGSVDGSKSKTTLKDMARLERGIKEMASIQVEVLWDWAENNYRWSASRSLVSGWVGKPKLSDMFSPKEVRISLDNAKAELVR